MALQNVGGATQKSGISRLTTEYIYWNITSANTFDGAVAEVAFVEDGAGKPVTGDWKAADIVPTPGAAEATPPKVSIRILVGPQPGGVDLTPATIEAQLYNVWVRIASGVERLVRPAGTLQVR